MEQLRRSVTAGMACDVCGRLPHPHRLRLTLAKLAAILPVEFALHAAVLALHPPYLLTVALLAVTTTALVIWIVEPSAMRLLRRWLHAPGHHLRSRTREVLTQAPSLWRIRVTLDDRAGELERLTRRLADLDANILGLHVHPIDAGVRDELVVSTPEVVGAEELLAGIESAGGRDVHVWPTTALALVDGQTEALNLAARVVADPAELSHAVAELLGARLVTDQLAVARGLLPQDGTMLKIPSPWSGLFVFTRPGEPFTPAESARAHRLAQVAELARNLEEEQLAAGQ
ncbi:amino acid-binding protein [Kribbella monticola]|uniref:amino acid-binding protein n=1 Tax=Kribbella monticola TaxID=2185285 RepID=UPI001E651E14|nr:amino acid-binding protein [Kribbella monticola]